MTQSAPLAALIREIIAAEGPIGLERYMALALGHPRHGYYITRDPLGAGGDFTTAPEISQMFGEMTGLWCAAVHEQMGSPGRLRLVELGPGRGTLMADLLRAATRLPRFGRALEVHLIETSPVLRACQAAALEAAGCPAQWHADLDAVPAGPAIVVANEFFDALPIRQDVRTERGWCQRLVGLDAEGGLAFGLAAIPEKDLAIDAPLGSVLERGIAGRAVAARLAARLASQGGAALLIDYGYAAPGFGETLQAVRQHRFVDPLGTPGEADLTAHVDFPALARVARAAGAAAHGPVTQGGFLRDLGIGARAEQLARRNPAATATLAAALARLAGPGDATTPGMGTLFKVLALTARDAPPPPGFPPALSGRPADATDPRVKNRPAALFPTDEPAP